MADIIRSIEPFELTQGFGENPASYAKFGLAGHNGWDFRTKFPDTPLGHRDILSSWLSEFYRQGVDPTGYGNFFEIVVRLKSTWKLTYAHCLSIRTFTKATEGQAMAISDSTGNSTGSHLHLTVKRIKIINGIHEVQNYSNGYFGAVNPQQFFDELRAYKKSGSAPVETGGIMVQVDDVKYKELITKCVNRDELYDYLGVSRDPVETAIDKPKAVVEGYKNLATGLQRQLEEAKTREQNKIDELARKQQSWDESAKILDVRIEGLENEKIALTKQVKTLEGQLTVHAQAEGNAKIDAANWKTKYEQAIAGLAGDLTFGMVIKLLWLKIKDIKLK